MIYEIIDRTTHSELIEKEYQTGAVLSVILIPKPATIDAKGNELTITWPEGSVAINQMNVIKPASSSPLDLMQKLGFMTQSNIGGANPFISSLEDYKLAPDTQKTIIVNGGNFSPESQIEIVDWPGSIDLVTFIDDRRIAVTATSGLVNGSYLLYVRNGGVASNDGVIEVTTNPSGKLSLLRSTDGPENIQLTAFAKTEQQGKEALNAFDGDIGTRHECEPNQQSGHFVGLLFAGVPTEITSWTVYPVDLSVDFELQGSNDTTDGTDGTWTTIDAQTITPAGKVELQGEHIYTAGVRLVWTNPQSNRVGVRDLIIEGRQ